MADKLAKSLSNKERLEDLHKEFTKIHEEIISHIIPLKALEQKREKIKQEMSELKEFGDDYDSVNGLSDDDFEFPNQEPYTDGIAKDEQKTKSTKTVKKVKEEVDKPSKSKKKITKEEIIEEVNEIEEVIEKPSKSKKAKEEIVEEEVIKKPSNSKKKAVKEEVNEVKEEVFEVKEEVIKKPSKSKKK